MRFYLYLFIILVIISCGKKNVSSNAPGGGTATAPICTNSQYLLNNVCIPNPVCEGLQTLNNTTHLCSGSFGFLTSTIAGSLNTVGFVNGIGSFANFHLPYGIAIDSNKNIFVADTMNHSIRKIAPDGTVTTLAGSGAQGSTDAVGISASFYFPLSVAVSISGNVYVADSGNNKIRKIAPDGTVTTLAGSGAVGNLDANGILATFNYPNGVAVDLAEVVYVADTNNNTIRMIAANGSVTTLAGANAGVLNGSGYVEGLGTAAKFTHPYKLAVDSFGNVLIADTNNHVIRKLVIATNIVSTLAGDGISGSLDGIGVLARFSSPQGITVDNSGVVYVSDSSNFTIRSIATDGTVTTLVGVSGIRGYTDGVNNLVNFDYPTGVTVDSSGYLYITESLKNTIRKIRP